MNRISILIILISVLITSKISAQTGWQWGKTNKQLLQSDYFYSAADNNGNFFVDVTPASGSLPIADTFGSIISSHPFVAKLDSAGHYLWVLDCFGGSVQSLVTDSIGNLYILGQYSWPIVIGAFTLSHPASIYFEYFAAKVSPTGIVLWATNIIGGAVYSPIPQGFTNLGVDGAGNTIITGQSKITSTSFGPATFTNADATGNTLDIFVCKLDTAGNFVWAKSFAGKSNDYVIATTVTKGGDLYISGCYTSDSLKINDTTILITDPASSFDTTRPYYPRLKGNYLIKFSGDGSLLWAHNMDYHEKIMGMSTDIHDNIYVAGYLDSTVVHGTHIFPALTGLGHTSAYFASYTASGSYKWGVVSSLCPLSPFIFGDIAYGIATDRCGNLLICGSMREDMNFSGHTLVYPTYPGVPFLHEPAFVVEYDTAGNYQNSIAIDGGGDDAMSISVDNRGNFFIEGDFWADTLVIAHDTLKPHSNDEYLLLAKYKYQTPFCPTEITLAGTISNTELADVEIYPNPATNECTISCKDGFKTNSKAEFYDVTGRLIGAYTLSNTTTVVSLIRFPTGVYQCRIYNDKGYMATKRVIIVK